MIAISISWLIISFTLISFGNIFVHFYNKICNSEEQYDLTDTLILGSCFILIPLSICHFFLPINQYILYACIGISILYWALNPQIVKKIISNLKTDLSKLSKTQITICIIAIIGILCYPLWGANIFDAAYYHHQNIRWNEELAIVPGLGNLEDRLAFNSNFFLLAALYSFRSIFNEPLYTLQSLIFVFITGNFFVKTINSGFNIKYILVLVLFIIFFTLTNDGLAESSTDIIPNLCTFYFIAKFALNPESIKNNFLFVIFVPISLISFKLSSAAFAILSFYFIYLLYKQKETRKIIVIVSFSSLIVLLWLVRNVIVSGYLIYPIHEIDFFSFDWEMPEGTLKRQRSGMWGYAQYMLKETLTFDFFVRAGIMRHKIWFINNIITLFLYLSLAISPLIMAFSYFKKVKINPFIYILYIFSFGYCLFCFLTAPDFRFMSGALFGILLILSIVIINFKNLDKSYPTIGYIVFATIAISLLLTSLKRFHNYYEYLNFEEGTQIDRSLSSVLLKPFASKFQIRPDVDIVEFTTYNLNGLTIYLTNCKMGRTFDKIPATWGLEMPLEPSGAKNQHITTIEARGKTLQDGFRTKPEFIDFVNFGEKK